MIQRNEKNSGICREHMFLWFKFLILIIDPHLKLLENWHASNH